MPNPALNTVTFTPRSVRVRAAVEPAMPDPRTATLSGLAVGSFEIILVISSKSKKRSKGRPLKKGSCTIITFASAFLSLQLEA